MNEYILDVEKYVLSKVARDPVAFSEAKSLKWYMFSSKIYQNIYKAIELCYESIGSVDYNILLDTITNHIEKDSDEYKPYLKSIFSLDVEFDFESYVNIIINSYKRRALISASSEFIALLQSGKGLEEVFPVFQQKINLISEVGSDFKVSGFSEILRKTWEDITVKSRMDSIPGIVTGINKLDLFTGGLNAGDLWIIAGRPGMGKTALMCNMALSQVMNKIPVGFISLEMRSIAIARRILSIYSGVPNENLRFGSLNNEQAQKVTSAIKDMESFPLYVDESFNHDKDSFRNSVINLVKKHGIKVLYLDYLQLLAERDVDSTHEIGRITREAKLLARDYDLAIVIGSQLNRQVELREDKHPVLADLRQSGNIEEDADAVIGLYRPIKYSNKVPHPELLELIVMKQREGASGRILASFDEKTYKIGDFNKDDGKLEKQRAQL